MLRVGFDLVLIAFRLRFAVLTVNRLPGGILNELVAFYIRLFIALHFTRLVHAVPKRLFNLASYFSVQQVVGRRHLVMSICLNAQLCILLIKTKCSTHVL